MVITNTTQYGRLTAAFGYALKARVLLYRASDLWNGNPDYKNFADKEGVKLFPQEKDNNRWAVAATAAKECIDECEKAGYKLYRSGNNDRSPRQ